jgi:hypothetical protein
MGMACSTNREAEERIKNFGGKIRRKETTRRTRDRWEDNIKMDLREDGVVWTGLICLNLGTSGGLL